MSNERTNKMIEMQRVKTKTKSLIFFVKLKKYSMSETTVCTKWNRISLISCDWDRARWMCVWFVLLSSRFTHMPHILLDFNSSAARCALIGIRELSCVSPHSHRFIAEFKSTACLSPCFYAFSSDYILPSLNFKMHKWWMQFIFQHNNNNTLCKLVSVVRGVLRNFVANKLIATNYICIAKDNRKIAMSCGFFSFFCRTEIQNFVTFLSKT